MQYRQPMQWPWSTSTMPSGPMGGGRQTLARRVLAVQALAYVLDAHAGYRRPAPSKRMNESVGSKLLLDAGTRCGRRSSRCTSWC